MCVHYTPDSDIRKWKHVPCKREKNSFGTMKKILHLILKEGGPIIAFGITLTCLTHWAECVPLGGNGNALVAVRLPEDVEDEVVPSDGPSKSASGFVGGFVTSLSMIIVSELGDKTFFIAAVMAMKHPRLTVFCGAMSALAFMTIFSALFGFVTTFIPRVYTYYISTFLFAIFGFKMLYDGIRMSSDEGSDELEEVNQTLIEEDENTPLTSTSLSSNEKLKYSKFRLTLRRILTTCFSKVYIQALTMTFLAEWGDRSQLATVVLAARENIFGVCFGGVLGHSFCTGLAVIGGRMLAQRISVKTVTIVGGFVFLGFAIISLFLDPNN